MQKFKSLHPSKNRASKIFKFLLKFFQVFFVFYAFILIYIQFFPAKSTLEENMTFVVIPGAGINRNGSPSPALKMRLDKSLELYKDKKVRFFFISGKVAEIFVMENYLMKHRIPKNKIVEDTEGINTFHTVRNVKQYGRKNVLNEKVVFVSQRYHLPRIALLLKKQGMKNARLVAANTLEVRQKEYLATLLREGFAIIKAFILDN